MTRIYDDPEVFATTAIAGFSSIYARHVRPVTGGVHLANSGQITVLVGGDEAVFQRVEPLLAACRAVGVPAVTEFTMSQLGRAAGIAVGTAAAAVPSR